MSAEKNKETKAGKDFWGFVEGVSATVASWPDWKKVGWDVGESAPNQQGGLKKIEKQPSSEHPSEQSDLA